MKNTWHIPTKTAKEVIPYKINSVQDATEMADSRYFSWLIKTKNTMSEIMTKTMTKIPVNNPVFECVQSIIGQNT